MINRKNRYFLLAMVLFLFPQPAFGQVRSGAAFLKMLPGARLQAMAASYTSGLDEAHAMYANPGAVGFLREWQWAATYTKWIADVYNTSLIYGTNFRTPWSRKTRLALGILYYGVPEFDSSDRAAPNASANDVVASLGLGQPLTIISNNIALGGNIKYLKSTLDQYDASTWVFDIGLLARTPRFSLRNSLFKYGILSAGIAVTQLGGELKFDRVGTPLPRTWRVGAAFYAGTHNGFQLQVLADYHNVKDEDGAFGVGAELSWRQWFSLNGGYNFNSDLMSHVSFGASIRLDDVQSTLPGRNNALQFDLATLDEGEFFSRTYHGSVKHYPIGPEGFRFIEPAMDDSLTSRSVVLRWEQTQDPDLYDDVQYTLLLDQDSTKLAQIISFYDNKDIDKFLSALSDSSLLVIEELEVDSFQVKDLVGGHYYWAVIAFDRDQHIRFAEKHGRRIAHFYIPYPDIEIQDIELEYSPWIAEDDYQGKFKISFTNKGDVSAEDFSIAVYDSIAGPYRSISEEVEKNEQLTRQLVKNHIEALKPGEIQMIQVPWHTSLLGPHQIVAQADIEQKVVEADETNNQYRQIFYTIPKGTFTCDDTVTIVAVSQVSIDMPIITEVCFDTNSTVVKPEYLHKTIFDPFLATLAERLKKNRHLRVWLKGFADPNSGETDIALANGRATAVRDSLIQLGVNANQIKILSGEVLPKRRVPKNPQDAKWVFEERRYVKITSDQKGQEVLFQPVRHIDNEELLRPVRFHSRIKCAVPVDHAWISCFHKDLCDSVSIQNLRNQLDIQGDLEWNPAERGSVSPWLYKNIGYYIGLTDTLGRTFRTRTQNTYLNKSVFQREHRIAFPLKFAQTDPLYSFYWSRIFDQVKKMLADPNKRMRFTGHACAIGPEEVNDRLSKRRASRFHKGFLNYVKTRHQEYFSQILQRLDPSEGFGEHKPLSIQRLNGERILIGDNTKPLGRKLNRRIEIIFSTTGPWDKKF